MQVNTKRIRRLDNISKGGRPLENRPVAYWMSRDQRVCDNWALIFASQLADKKRGALIVFFCLYDGYPEPTSGISLFC